MNNKFPIRTTNEFGFFERYGDGDYKFEEAPDT